MAIKSSILTNFEMRRTSVFFFIDVIEILTNWMMPQMEIINPQRESFGPQIFMSKFAGKTV